MKKPPYLLPECEVVLRELGYVASESVGDTYRYFNEETQYTFEIMHLPFLGTSEVLVSIYKDPKTLPELRDTEEDVLDFVVNDFQVDDWSAHDWSAEEMEAAQTMLDNAEMRGKSLPRSFTSDELVEALDSFGLNATQAIRIKRLNALID